VEISAVSERLGHSNVRVTAEVYTHAIPERDDEAARKWEEFQNRPETRVGGVQCISLEPSWWQSVAEQLP